MGGSAGRAFSTMMEADDVVEIMTHLRQADVDVWLDGGWAVDALVGHPTRPHDDLDLLISIHDVPRATEILGSVGFSVDEGEDPTDPARFVLTDHRDRRIDFHKVTFDADGGGTQQLQDGRSYRYPPEGFGGEGTVSGIPMRCLTAEVQVECHLGYEPHETDHHDMRLLKAHLGVTLPPPYRQV